MADRTGRRNSAIVAQNKMTTQKKHTDLNRFFEKSQISIEFAAQTSSNEASTKPAESIPFNESAIFDQISAIDKNQSADKLMEMIDTALTVIQTVSEDLANSFRRLRDHRNTPQLSVVDNANVMDGERPLLEKFCSYKLPLESKEMIDKLERDLNSHEFLTFFVSLLNLTNSKYQFKN